jgi:transposase
MEYSGKFVERMVGKMTGPGGRSATSLSKEVGVPQSTLSRWLREAKLGPMTSKKRVSKEGKARRWTAEEKLRVVREAAQLDEGALGEFLRREGVHESELEQLRAEVDEAALRGLEANRPKRGLSAEQKKIRQLEKELKRKEKALAEAAALLVLRGKVQAFLSEDEEGATDESNEK